MRRRREVESHALEVSREHDRPQSLPARFGDARSDSRAGALPKEDLLDLVRETGGIERGTHPVAVDVQASADLVLDHQGSAHDGLETQFEDALADLCQGWQRGVGRAPGRARRPEAVAETGCHISAGKEVTCMPDPNGAQESTRPSDEERIQALAELLVSGAIAAIEDMFIIFPYLLSFM